MIKKIGYVVFAFFFYLSRMSRTDENKIFFVATHDDSPEGNIGIVADAIKRKYNGKRCIWFTRNDTVAHPFNFFVRKAYHLATSQYVFLDNEFLPMAYLRFPKRTKVVQLWHGTGTIKKFGQDVNTGSLKKLEFRANQRITHLIVNSEAVKREYASAFGIPPGRIYVLGLPRTDLLLKPSYLGEKRGEFLAAHENLRGKRCILYAPTFRDDEVESPRIHLELSRMHAELKENDVLLIRLHPHVENRLRTVLENGKWDNIINVSGYSGVTTLLAVADVLVTDYSSIIFEYCLRRKPMIFYAYDLEQFESDGRGFYRNYRTYVPGPVVTHQKELSECLKSGSLTVDNGFIEENFKYLDGSSTTRLLELIFSSS